LDLLAHQAVEEEEMAVQAHLAVALAAQVILLPHLHHKVIMGVTETQVLEVIILAAVVVALAQSELSDLLVVVVVLVEMEPLQRFLVHQSLMRVVVAALARSDFQELLLVLVLGALVVVEGVVDLFLEKKMV
jgi:hypothetical protein